MLPEHKEKAASLKTYERTLVFETIIKVLNTLGIQMKVHPIETFEKEHEHSKNWDKE